MWVAVKNVETGTVHAVSHPSGTSAHGLLTMSWPMEQTYEAVNCRECLHFLYRWRLREPALEALLSKGNLSRPAQAERRCRW